MGPTAIRGIWGRLGLRSARGRGGFSLVSLPLHPHAPSFLASTNVLGSHCQDQAGITNLFTLTQKTCGGCQGERPLELGRAARTDDREPPSLPPQSWPALPLDCPPLGVPSNSGEQRRRRKAMAGPIQGGHQRGLETTHTHTHTPFLAPLPQSVHCLW